MLRAVDGGAYANLELPKILRSQRISGRDAAFATDLAYGTLRLRGRYDPIIAMAADRTVTSIDRPVLDTLRLGTHQLLGMRVPEHAAVAETVALARQVNGVGAAGFVNAVLRRVSERSLDSWLDAVAPADLEPTAALAIRESHPQWIVKALRQALIGHGQATPDIVDAQLAELLAADNDPARVSLVARPGLATVDELLSAGGEPGRWAPTAVQLPGGDPGGLAAVREGRAAVQDEGSQLVTLALAAVSVASEPTHSTGERWLDMCAGPGGKAGLLAALAIERGARLVANEISEHRADLVRSTLGAAIAAAPTEAVEVRVSDGREIGSLEPAAYDRVLLDAPCTGLGALRRRPEARWRRTSADLATLTKLQRELLHSALDATRPGGVVAYVTCSPHLAETRFAVADVLKQRHDVHELSPSEVGDAFDAVAPGLLGSLAAGPDPFDTSAVQLWPHVHATDAMFCALLRNG